MEPHVEPAAAAAPQSVRVAVVEDHWHVRESLERLLVVAEGIEFVGSAADGDGGIELAGSVRPDVLLLDLSMPGISGIEAVPRILERSPETRVVVLTSFHDRDRVLDAVDGGAVGYLLKDTEPLELLRAIRATAAGSSPLDPRAASALVSARSSAPSTQSLSDREQEVLELVADGLPNKLIARRLEISEKTVKAHLTRVFQAIGVSDRTQAALWLTRKRERTGR